MLFCYARTDLRNFSSICLMALRIYSCLSFCFAYWYKDAFHRFLKLKIRKENNKQETKEKRSYVHSKKRKNRRFHFPMPFQLHRTFWVQVHHFLLKYVKETHFIFNGSCTRYIWKFVFKPTYIECILMPCDASAFDSCFKSWLNWKLLFN